MEPVAQTERVFELLRRYDRPGPRYTSYPTAVEFHDGYAEADYREKLAEANALADRPLSLYVHLPFCEERCAYCGCNVVITRKRGVAADYLRHLHGEIDLLAQHLPQRKRISQYHWGGGTPTYLSPEQMAALQLKISEHFEIDPNGESAVEIDPRVTSAPQLELLRELGFNRVSLGVQDFTPEVREAIGRRQSEEQTRILHNRCRDLGFVSVNFDLIYGLPLQRLGNFERNIEIALELRPHRVALYSFAHVPWLKPHQRKIDPASLPDAETKLRLFCMARTKFLEAGYVQIGMDHFALPGDELVLAMRARRLHRNFMGYTVRKGADLVGLGISAIGDVRGSFAQNVKKLPAYYQAIAGGRFPIEKGYLLDRDDRLRREVITRLICNFHVDCHEIEAEFGIDFSDYFADELAELGAKDGPVAHGFLIVEGGRLEVTESGRLFVRNLCMVFDRHLRKKDPKTPVFSRTV